MIYFILARFSPHCPLSALIRPLRYGFRKVLTIEQGGLKGDKDDLEFQHPSFVHGKPELLIRIKRRAPAATPTQHVQMTAAKQEAFLDRAEMEEKVGEDNVVLVEDNVVLAVIVYYVPDGYAL